MFIEAKAILYTGFTLNLILDFKGLFYFDLIFDFNS